MIEVSRMLVIGRTRWIYSISVLSEKLGVARKCFQSNFIYAYSSSMSWFYLMIYDNHYCRFHYYGWRIHKIYKHKIYFNESLVLVFLVFFRYFLFVSVLSSIRNEKAKEESHFGPNEKWFEWQNRERFILIVGCCTHRSQTCAIESDLNGRKMKWTLSGQRMRRRRGETTNSIWSLWSMCVTYAMSFDVHYFIKNSGFAETYTHAHFMIVARDLCTCFSSAKDYFRVFFFLFLFWLS